MKDIKTILRRTRKKKIYAVSIAHLENDLVNSIVKGSLTGPKNIGELSWMSHNVSFCSFL